MEKKIRNPKSTLARQACRGLTAIRNGTLGRLGKAGKGRVHGLHKLHGFRGRKSATACQAKTYEFRLWHEPARTGTNWHEPARTGTNRHELARTGTFRHRSIPVRSDRFVCRYAKPEDVRGASQFDHKRLWKMPTASVRISGKMKRLITLTTLLASLASVGCEWTGTDSSPGPRTGEPETLQEDHYSILLSVHNDPVNHVQDADYYKKVLTEKIGWRDVFVIHKGGHSEVFRGQYRTTKDAEPNLKTAKKYRAANGVAIFAKAMVVPLPGKDIGPAEWNLSIAAESAYYSLLVAIFRDDPENNYVGRRRFAVDYCRQLRKGGYEAYFYHAPAVSHVTIGAFGEKAVTIRKKPRGETLEINDPAIKSLQKDFEFLALNGMSIDEVIRDRQTGKQIRMARKNTYLIRVPGKSRPGDVLYKDVRNQPVRRPR